jgi:hypothetical protein
MASIAIACDLIGWCPGEYRRHPLQSGGCSRPSAGSLAKFGGASKPHGTAVRHGTGISCLTSSRGVAGADDGAVWLATLVPGGVPLRQVT